MATERFLHELQNLLVELEELLKESGEEVAAEAGEALAGWHTRVKGLHARLNKLQGQAQDRLAGAAKSAQHVLEGNPWRAVVIAAAAGLLVGLALGSREGPPAPPP